MESPFAPPNQNIYNRAKRPNITTKNVHGSGRPAGRLGRVEYSTNTCIFLSAGKFILL